MPDIRIVGGDQNNPPITAASVEPLTRRNALIVAQVNVSGDIVNPGGGGSGGDGAILDGVDSGIKATVLNDATTLPSASNKALAVQLASSTTRQIGKVTQDGPWSSSITGDVLLRSGQVLDVREQGAIGVNVIGGSIGARISSSGDTLNVREQGIVGVQIVGGNAHGTVGVTGDVTVTPKAGSTWPVSVEINEIDYVASGRIGVTGDVSVREQAVTGIQIVGGSVGGRVSISGDSLNVNEQQKTGVHVAAGSIGVTGDVNVTATNLDIRDLSQATDQVGAHQKGAWSVGITGDINITSFPDNEPFNLSQWGGTATTLGQKPKASGVPVSIASDQEYPVQGAQIVGGSVGGRVSISGDSLNVNEQQKTGVHVAAGSVGVTGDVNVTATNLDIRDLTVADKITVGAVTAPVGVTGDLNTTLADGVSPSVKATVKDYANANPLAVVLTNVSGDVYNALGAASGGDGAILDGVSSSIKATVKDYTNAKPLVVALANVSGDIYNALGAASGGDGALLDGVSSSIKATVLDAPTARPVSTDNPLLVQFADDQTRDIGRLGSTVGVQVIGGSIGAQVSASGDLDIRNLVPTQDSVHINSGSIGVTGDVSTTPKAGSTWPVSAASGLNVREQDKTGVHVAAGSIGITGDVTATNLDIRDLVQATDQVGTHQKGAWSVGITGDVTATNLDIRDLLQASDNVGAHQKGAWATAVTGDVLLRQNNGVNIGNIGSPIGVQIVGGSVGGTVGISGDAAVNAIQRGAWAVAVTGDVLLRQQASNTPIGTLSTPIGVQIIGGSVGAECGFSGDTLNVREQGVVGVQVVGGSGGGTIGVTGDVRVRQTGGMAMSISGDSGVLATVRDYTNANPIAVVLTNVSGDTYNAESRRPELHTVTGRVTAAGTTTVAGPYAGQAIKVTSYDIQAEADTAQCYFGSAASGERLTPQWLLNTREGVAKQVPQYGCSYIFKTRAGKALVLENAGNNFRYSVSYFSGDAL